MVVAWLHVLLAHPAVDLEEHQEHLVRQLRVGPAGEQQLPGLPRRQLPGDGAAPFPHLRRGVHLLEVDVVLRAVP